MARSQPIEVGVTIGVDTHAEAHVAVALDQLGRRLGTCTVPTTEAGYAASSPRTARRLSRLTAPTP